MYKTALILAFALPILAGCDGNVGCTEGNGIVTTISRRTAPFHSLKLDGSFEVVLARGTDRNIQIEADSNLHAQIRTEVKREELVISSDDCINTNSPIRILVTAPAFRSLEINGSGRITSQELISSDEDELLELSIDGSGAIDLEVFTKMVKSDIDGSGTIHLKGKTDGQVVTVEGSGNYNAFELKAAESVINLSGSGEVKVHSTGALSIENSGSGNVRYKGSPAKLSSDVSGSGKVIQE